MKPVHKATRLLGYSLFFVYLLSSCAPDSTTATQSKPASDRCKIKAIKSKPFSPPSVTSKPPAGDTPSTAQHLPPRGRKRKNASALSEPATKRKLSADEEKIAKGKKMLKNLQEACGLSTRHLMLIYKEIEKKSNNTLGDLLSALLNYDVFMKNKTSILNNTSKKSIQEVIEFYTEKILQLKDDQGNTILHLAAYENAKWILDFLINLPGYQDASNEQNNQGDTPLHTAVDQQCMESFTSLLKSKISPTCSKEVIEIRNKEGHTLLHIAVLAGNLKIFEMLLNAGADVNAEDNNKDTPLILAAYLGDADLVKYLLEQGANPNATNVYERTALYYAVKNGNSSIVEELLKRGANVFSKDKDGNTVLDVVKKIRDITSRTRSGSGMYEDCCTIYKLLKTAHAGGTS